MAENEPITIDIDKDGDVILAVGEPIKSRLRVSSAILSRASKVFAALFSPRFSEGQDLGSTAEPKLIRLLEDNPTAISDICHLLHGEETDLYTDSPFSERIMPFAVAVDKYDCLKPLRLHGQAILLGWLDANPQQTQEGVHEARIMAAAYLLEHRRTFSLITERLIQRWSSSFIALNGPQPRGLRFSEELLQLLPTNALYAIEERRAAAHRKITSRLTWSFLVRRCGNKCRTNLFNQSDYTLATFTAATGIDPWPPQIGLHQTILDIIKVLENRAPLNTVSSCEHRHNIIVDSQEFRVVARQLRSITRGLCLDCVKQGAMRSNTCVKAEHGYSSG